MTEQLKAYPIRITDDLREKLKELAKKRGTSLHKIIVEALYEKLGEDDDETKNIRKIAGETLQDLLKKEMTKTRALLRRDMDKKAKETLEDLLKKYDLIQQTKI